MQEESRLITTALVVPGNVNDCQLVEPAVKQREEGLGHVPPELTADKGADTGPLRATLQRRGIVVHIPVCATNNVQGGDLFKPEDFTYYPNLQLLICPAGKEARKPKRDKVHWRDGYEFTFKKAECRACALKEKCQRRETKRTGRQVYVAVYWSLNRAAESHVQTREFESAYGKRGRIEAKISEVVYHGGRRCRYRGNARSRVQLWITVIAVNGKRLTKLLARKAGADPGPGEESTSKAA